MIALRGSKELLPRVPPGDEMQLLRPPSIVRLSKGTLAFACEIVTIDQLSLATPVRTSMGYQE